MDLVEYLAIMLQGCSKNSGFLMASPVLIRVFLATETSSCSSANALVSPSFFYIRKQRLSVILFKSVLSTAGLSAQSPPKIRACLCSFILYSILRTVTQIWKSRKNVQCIVYYQFHRLQYVMCVKYRSEITPGFLSVLYMLAKQRYASQFMRQKVLNTSG